MRKKTECQFIDGVQRSKESPTFGIPTTHDRESLTPGFFAKVGLEWEGPSPNWERFWVEVTKAGKDKDGKIFYEGEVNNHLRHVALDLGEVISFSPENILDVLPPNKPKNPQEVH